MPHNEENVAYKFIITFNLLQLFFVACKIGVAGQESKSTDFG